MGLAELLGKAYVLDSADVAWLLRSGARLLWVGWESSASHVVLLLVKKYPQYNIINFDKLDCMWLFCCVFRY